MRFHPTTIYALFDPLSGDVKYVGQTRNLTNRVSQHLADLGRRNPAKAAWVRSLGGKRPIVKVLEVVTDGRWGWREKWWINEFKSRGAALLNRNDGCAKAADRAIRPPRLITTAPCAPKPNMLARTSLLTLEEAANRLNMSRNGLLSMLQAKGVQVVRLGPKTVRVRSADLERVIEQSLEPAAPYGQARAAEEAEESEEQDEDRPTPEAEYEDRRAHERDHGPDYPAGGRP